MSSIPGSQRSLGYWKFNNSFINDSNFVDSIREHINELILHHEAEKDIRVFGSSLNTKSGTLQESIQLKRKS